jgi:sialate O-acetylesterase
MLAGGPVLEAQEMQDGKIVLTFDRVGEGLESLDGEALEGFAIAGEDRIFHPAEAEMIGPDRVALSSPQVEKPVAVRYAWAPNPTWSLINSEKLPARPFRTDDWDEPITRR